MTSQSIAIIPARGGSKAIPHKNLKQVGGLSLLARTIQACHFSSCISTVYVSTDSHDIAQEALAFRAHVIDRPSHLSTDTSSSESAIHHSLLQIQNSRSLPSHFLFLQCTSPFTSPTHIDSLYAESISTPATTAFSATSWHGFLWSPSGDPINHDPKRPRQRRQDLPPVLIETGSAYSIPTDDFLITRSRFSTFNQPVPIDFPYIDIDSQHDLDHARFLSTLYFDK